jgi:uncharacterized membrane protein HdeD (DUF308 family)
MKEQSATTEQSPADALKHVAGLSIGLAVLMIVAGIFAIAKPFAAGIGISIFLGWLMVFSGVIYMAYAFAAQGVGSFFGRLLIGILYAFGGFYLISNPGIALQSLTFVVGVVLIVEGVVQGVSYFQVRSVPGSGWILFDGVVTLVLGILILYPWPGSSGWAIGTIVGVNLLISGFTRLMYSITGRKLVDAAAG